MNNCVCRYRFFKLLLNTGAIHRNNDTTTGELQRKQNRKSTTLMY